MSTDTLTAIIDFLTDDVSVTDDDGGVWRPCDEARVEILASDDPEATAIRIVTTTPMRGEWRQ